MSNQVRIYQWNAGRGFGFVEIAGEKVFVPISAITNRPEERGVDLEGRLLEVHSYSRGNQGLKVDQAELIPEPEEFDEAPSAYDLFEPEAAAISAEDLALQAIAEYQEAKQAYEIAMLPKEVVVADLPQVEVRICTYYHTYQLGGYWESDDGYMAGNDSRTVTAARGGIRIAVQDPHFKYFIESEGLDLMDAEEEIRHHVEIAANDRNGEVDETWSETMVQHIMAHIPAFVEMKDLWFVDESVYQLQALLEGIPHGLAYKQIANVRDENIHQSTMSTIIRTSDAKKFDVAGEPLKGLQTVYWPQGEDERAELANRRAEMLQAQAQEFMTRSYYELTLADLKKKITKVASGVENYTSGYGVESWSDREQSTIDEFEAIVAELIDLEQRQNAGLILVDLRVEVRRQGASQNRDTWVINQAGEVVEPGRVEKRESNHRFSHKYWRIACEQDLVVQWWGGLTGEVKKLPVGGVTEAQQETVKKIEAELNLQPNAFGLDTKAGSEQDRFMQAIEEALREKSRILASVPEELDYHLVTTHNGQMNDDDWDFRVNIDSLWDKIKKAPEVEMHRRTAKLVEEIRNVAGGRLQILIFEKYGQMNATLRWIDDFTAELMWACHKTGFLVSTPEFDIELVKTAKGHELDSSSWYWEGEIRDRLSTNPREIDLDGKKGLLIKETPLTDGMLQFVACEVYGRSGMTIRWAK